MAQLVGDGLTMAQATGQRVRDGVGAVASGIREEVDAVRRHGEHAAHARPHSVWRARLIEVAAAVAGSLAAFVVSRLVRARLRGSGR
jgi:hypothetical protein